MKNLFIIILLFISMCLWAQNVPQTIDYQGRLADSDGNYLNGVVTVNFLIYNVETGGTELWNEIQDVSTANGIFHVQLGSISAFPGTLFDGADRWLELIVGGETLSPRTQIASIPYSIKAETAYTVEVPLILSGNVSYPNSIIKGENTGTGIGVYATSNGNYGVYATSTGTGSSRGGYFEGGSRGVEGCVNSTESGSKFGVIGSAVSLGTNYGIYGLAYSGYYNYAGYFDGDVHISGTLTGPSDERFKENVQPFKNALSKIKLMNVHTFNFKQMDEEKLMVLPEGEQIGLIAQELEEILPELVKDEVHAYDKNEGIEGAESDMERIEYKGINYIGLIPVLIEAMKEQQQQIEELQQQIAELK